MSVPNYFVLDWCGESYEVLVRGHVDAGTYAVAVQVETGTPWTGQVSHRYGRWMPPSRARAAGCDRFFEQCQGPARGAVAFTIRADAP